MGRVSVQAQMRWQASDVPLATTRHPAGAVTLKRTVALSRGAVVAEGGAAAARVGLDNQPVPRRAAIEDVDGTVGTRPIHLDGLSIIGEGHRVLCDAHRVDSQGDEIEPQRVRRVAAVADL